MVCGCVVDFGKANLYFCDGSINADKYVKILEQYMMPSRQYVSGDVRVFFSTSQCKTCDVLQTKQRHGRGRRRCSCWAGLTAVLTCHQQRMHGEVETKNAMATLYFRTRLKEEWHKITPELFRPLVSSMS